MRHKCWKFRGVKSLHFIFQVAKSFNDFLMQPKLIWKEMSSQLSSVYSHPFTRLTQPLQNGTALLRQNFTNWESFSIFCVCELNLEDLINIFGFKIMEKWSIVSKQVKWLYLAEWLDSRERCRIRFIFAHPQSSICKIAFCNIFSPFSLFLNTMYYFSMSLAPKTKTIIRMSKFNLFMPKYSVMLNMC